MCLYINGIQFRRLEFRTNHVILEYTADMIFYLVKKNASLDKFQNTTVNLHYLQWASGNKIIWRNIYLLHLKSLHSCLQNQWWIYCMYMDDIISIPYWFVYAPCVSFVPHVFLSKQSKFRVTLNFPKFFN